MSMVSAHLVILSLTFIVMAYADHEALAYIRGKKLLLNARVIFWVHWLVWACLFGMIVTGFFLALPLFEYLITLPMFYIKMAFVITLCANGWVIGSLSHIASTKPFQELTKRERLPLFVSGFISFISWVGAACIGFFFL